MNPIQIDNGEQYQTIYTAAGRIALKAELSILYGHSVTSDGCLVSSAESM